MGYGNPKAGGAFASPVGMTGALKNKGSASAGFLVLRPSYFPFNFIIIPPLVFVFPSLFLVGFLGKIFSLLR